MKQRIRNFSEPCIKYKLKTSNDKRGVQGLCFQLKHHFYIIILCFECLKLP